MNKNESVFHRKLYICMKFDYVKHKAYSSDVNSAIFIFAY